MKTEDKKRLRPGERPPVSWEKRMRREEREPADDLPRPEKRPCYRDGSPVNECWDQKNC